MYGRIVSSGRLEMNHVTQIVGGVMSQQKHIGQAGVRFTTVPKAQQADAVQFLLTTRSRRRRSSSRTGAAAADGADRRRWTACARRRTR